MSHLSGLCGKADTSVTLPKREKGLCLVFKGAVGSGMGMYSELIFPGPEEIESAPADWPNRQEMQPGSLNIKIQKYPDNLSELTGSAHTITGLDRGAFQPEFSIPHHKIANNMLSPRDGVPNRGIAQIWRCTVTNETSGEEFKAWVVRRIGSAYSNILELMADRKLRDAHDLHDGTPVTLRMHAG